MTAYQVGNYRHFELLLENTRRPLWSIPERVYRSRLGLASKSPQPLFVLFPLPGPLSVTHLYFLFPLWGRERNNFYLFFKSHTKTYVHRKAFLGPAGQGLSPLPALVTPCTLSVWLSAVLYLHYDVWMTNGNDYPYSVVVGHFVIYLMIDIIIIFRQQYYTQKKYIIIIKVIMLSPSLKFKLLEGRDYLGLYITGYSVSSTVPDT